MKRSSIAWTVILISFGLLTSAVASQETLQIAFKKYELSNGLDVILHEDHSIPIVHVLMGYGVGMDDDRPDQTELAHLFEHLMYLGGSQHHPNGHPETLMKIGGNTNAFTSRGGTGYYTELPSNHLELALWLESDRMGFLLPAITQEKLNVARDAVRNELQRWLDRPYVKPVQLIRTLLYPAEHPYSRPNYEHLQDDLSATSLADIAEFYHKYYTPNNASLCIVGDFDSDRAEELVEYYFASIPPGPPLERLSSWKVELDGVKRFVAEDDVALAQLHSVWHVPAETSPGDAEFRLLADILSGKTSRLYRALVVEQGIAQDVRVRCGSKELVSTFGVRVTARKGHTLADLENAVDAELKMLLAEGITTDELAQAKGLREAAFIRRLESFDSRADLLNYYNLSFGDPGKFQWDIDRYKRVTVADIQIAAQKYLDFDRRVIAYIVPQGDLVAGTTELDRSAEPSPGPERPFTPPSIQRAKLSNGLDLLLVEDHRFPLVQVNLIIKSGMAAGKRGVASLTTALLDESTTSRSALQISGEAKRLGANLTTRSDFDSSQVNLNVLSRNLDRGLALWGDVVLNPRFPDEAIERQRTILLGRIQQGSKEPRIRARRVYHRILYGPDHPYGDSHPGSGSAKLLKQDDVVDYYRTNYLPDNAAVVMVGDITLDAGRQKLEGLLGRWEPGVPIQSEVPDPTPLTSTTVYIVDRPGARQSAMMIGHLGISRSDPDYPACEVMNNAFGKRLWSNLRESKGYTYYVASAFRSACGIGPFYIELSVDTAKTEDALLEIVNEVRDVVGPRPLTDGEVAISRNHLVKGFPQLFQSFQSLAGQLNEVVLYGLPDDQWKRYIKEVSAVATAGANEAARSHLHPGALLIVVVGDRQKIERGIRELDLGEIAYFDPVDL